MKLYPLITPLGIGSYLLMLAAFLSGFPRRRKGWRKIHHWVSWTAMIVATIHGAIVLYLRYL